MNKKVTAILIGIILLAAAYAGFVLFQYQNSMSAGNDDQIEIPVMQMIKIIHQLRTVISTQQHLQSRRIQPNLTKMMERILRIQLPIIKKKNLPSLSACRIRFQVPHWCCLR